MKVVGLPFSVEVDGDVTAGSAATLQLFLDDPFDDECFDQLRCVVVWFARLASLGGFGGARVAPDACLASLRSDEPDSRSLRPTWTFNALKVDPRAIVSLANLVLCSRHPITRFVLSAVGAPAPDALEADAYVQRWARHPFRITEGPNARNVELSIDFSNDLESALHAPLCDALRVWAMLCALGAFREAGPLQDRPDLVPDDDPQITLDQLTFTFRDYGLEAGAYDALLNLLAAFSSRYQAISSVALD
jgi:hypothetical protein